MNWYITALRKYADFKGRSRRKEYWMFCLFQFIFLILAGIIDNMLGLNFGILPYGPIYLIYMLAMFVPSLAVTVRRLHDMGRSGWWFLIALVPLVGAVVLLVFMCLDSQPGPNQWGPNPKDETASFGNEALDSHMAR